jgi:hypothetical protein
MGRDYNINKVWVWVLVTGGVWLFGIFWWMVQEIPKAMRSRRDNATLLLLGYVDIIIPDAG